VADTGEPTLDLHRAVGDLLRRLDQELAVLWRVQAEVEGLMGLMHRQRAGLERLQAMLENQIKGLG